MSSRNISMILGAVGLLIPVIVILIDRLSAHGWWPRWVVYVWPTSYMLIANSAIMDFTGYLIAALSALLNALIYAAVGFLIAFAARAMFS